MIVEVERGQRALQQSGSGSLSQVEETGTGGGEWAPLIFISGLKHSGKDYVCFILNIFHTEQTSESEIHMFS